MFVAENKVLQKKKKNAASVLLRKRAHGQARLFFLLLFSQLYTLQERGGSLHVALDVGGWGSNLKTCEISAASCERERKMS